MTCIATDGKTMAGDGLSVVGSLIVEVECEKVRRHPGGIVGIAGERTINELVHRWFADGEDPDKLPDVGKSANDETLFDALILRPDGRVEFMDERFVTVSRAVPAVVGSGGEIALGLLLAGWSPGDAVAEVAKRVSTVGGRIVEIGPEKGTQ